MQGFVSFILVFVSVPLLLSALSISQAAGHSDLSKAVAVERAYGLHMNAKEAVLEAVRQGSGSGFAAYDSSHDILLCRHCPDHYCVSPSPLNPAPPNACDSDKCGRCFREAEARAAAELGALTSMSSLRPHIFDGDFSVGVGTARTEAFLRAEPLAKNSISLDFVRFRDALPISVDSERLEVRGKWEIPQGTVVRHG